MSGVWGVLRVSVRRQRAAGVAAAVCFVLGVWLARAVTVPMYRVQAEVLVAESDTIYRLTDPFDAVPRLSEGLGRLPEALTAKRELVALVKRTALVDRWESTRPAPIRWKNRLMERLRGPASEADRLEALIAMLDDKLAVWVERDRLLIACEWPDRHVAWSVVQGVLESLRRLRLERDVKAIDSSALALDEQRFGVEAEMQQRLEFIDEQWRAAAQTNQYPQYAGAREQLLRDAARRAELWLQASNAHLRAETMARSSKARYVVSKPPLLPKRPQTPPWSWWVVASLSNMMGVFVFGALIAAVKSRTIVWNRQLPIQSVASIRARWLSAPTSWRWPLVWPSLLFGVASGVALGLGRGNPMAGLAPGVVLVAGYLLWKVELRWPLFALMLLAVTVDDPTDRPYVGLWQSPLYPIGKILYSNIAWLTGFELAVVGLAALTVLRRIAGVRNVEARGTPGPAPLRGALVLSLATVVWLIGWGLLKGGVFREALWQFRALIFMPVVAFLCLFALEVPRDLKWLGRILVVGSVVKSLFGTYFMYRIAFPMGEYPPHTTGHNDTMIFSIGVVLALVRIFERPTWRHVLEACAWLPILGLALKLNDRRIAYVDIALSLAFIFAVSPMHRMKRLMVQGAMAMAPVVFLYLVAGWNSQSSVFRPVAKIRSIVAPAADTEEESSNVERDIENFNILKSWERNMILGQGFGHAFSEFVPSNDFAQSNFGHIGHNSVLWLLWIGGAVGFLGVWLYLGVACFFFARALRQTSVLHERIGLLVSSSVIITYLLQSFGDMGALSMMFVFFVSATLGVIGKTVIRTVPWHVPGASLEANMVFRRPPLAAGESLGLKITRGGRSPNAVLK
jgi:hypothetical protein